ncbi:phosphatidate cytidylyltransferase [Primorskyibacter sp. S187A]|uniref:phosphatidate cytidylyltransferase n=1 Tax=Primorskyibacter sp. S187A TaxID=3415130 RepID=UPI003C7BAF41
MTTDSKWNDLATRMGSGGIMVAVGILGIWIGGHVFHVLISAVCGAMIWELVRMLQPGQPRLAMRLGIASAVALLIASYLPLGVALPLILAPAFVGIGQMTKRRTRFTTYATATLLAGLGMIALRDDFGVGWMVWLVLVVVVTDVAGYFAGRLIGGPKFWPAVSPKKTWSGTVAGWVGAAAVGLYYATYMGGGVNVIGISIALSMASQLGDIAESAMKRQAGVKDSSALIPGHGGVLDRFDGMLGASLMLLIVEALVDFPPVTA